MKRHSSRLEKSPENTAFPLSRASIRQVDMSRAKRVFDCDVRLPEPDECPALHAFLHGEEPSAEHFADCLGWCVQHGYPDVVASIQSAYPAFTAGIDLTTRTPRVAAWYLNAITDHRIDCGLNLKVSDPAMSLHLAARLESPQCAISELILQLPAWNRRTGGSLLAGLGSAIAMCPSIRQVTLCGPKDGGWCDLETSFIAQAISNALLSLRLGRALAWYDGAWPSLGMRILKQMLERKDSGSMSLQLAEAYANAIALNGARSGLYEVELGLSASWRSNRAQALEAAPDAEQGWSRNSPPGLAYVVHRSADEWDRWLLQESEQVTADAPMPQANERGRYLWVTFPAIPSGSTEEGVFLSSFLSGTLFANIHRFADLMSWCSNEGCLDALRAIQVRVPFYTSDVPAVEWKMLQLAHEFGIVFSLDIGFDPESISGAIRILSWPGIEVRTITFNWYARQDGVSSLLRPILEAAAKAPSIVNVRMKVDDPTGESLVLALNSASTMKRIEYMNGSIRADCAGLKPATERALRGSLTALNIKATDAVLRTIVETIAATGSECRLERLGLRRLAAVDRNIDLSMLFRGQQRISRLELSASLTSDYGIRRLAEAIRCSPSIVALEVERDQREQPDFPLHDAVEPHLQANRHRQRYSEVGPAMLKSLVNSWSKETGDSHAIGDALQGVWRYLADKDLRSLASTSKLLSSQFRVTSMKTLDEIIMATEARTDNDLRWIVDQFKPPVLVDPRLKPLRDGLTRIATSALSRGIRHEPATEQPRTAGTDGEAFREVVDLALAAKVQRMVQDFKPDYLCEAVRFVLEGRRPDRDAFQACVVWCSESESMQVVAAIQQRWPTFSALVDLDGSDEDASAILGNILAHGIRCEVRLTINDEEELADLESTLGQPQSGMMRTLGIVFDLEEEMQVPESLAQRLAGMNLRGLCLIGNDGPVTLAPGFLPELLRGTSIEQLTLRGEFITGEIEVDEARQWFEQSALRSLHVQTDPSLVDTLGRAIVATDGKCRIVDLELLSTRTGDYPAFAWIRALLHPKLGISSLALDEEQLASLPSWQWQDIGKINHCLLNLRPVTHDFKRSVPRGVAAQMVVRNQQIHAQVTGWAIEMFMRRWARSNNLRLLLNRPWMNALLAYGDEPHSFDGLRSVNRAMAEAAREATASIKVRRDVHLIDVVLHQAAQPGSGSLGVDRIVNYLRNHKHSLTAEQDARLRIAVVGRIERYLDRWQDGSLPRLNATAAT